MGDTFRLGRIRGIPIGMHWSVLVVAGLIAWALGAEGLPSLDAGHPAVEYFVTAGLVTVVFLVALLLHELGHAVVAQRLGTRVEGITLWLFGGMSKLGSDNPSAAAEWRIGIAGPLVSIVLGLGFLVAAAGIEAVAPSALASTALAWLGVINLVLAAFNLLPAYPLDGGRVLRALLWAHHGDRLRATEQVVAVSAVVCAGLVLLGLAMAVLLGAWLNGFWMAAIAWFVRTAGRNEAEAVRRDEVARHGPRGPAPLVGPELRRALAAPGAAPPATSASGGP